MRHAALACVAFAVLTAAAEARAPSATLTGPAAAPIGARVDVSGRVRGVRRPRVVLQRRDTDRIWHRVRRLPVDRGRYAGRVKVQQLTYLRVVVRRAQRRRVVARSPVLHIQALISVDSQPTYPVPTTAP